MDYASVLQFVIFVGAVLLLAYILVVKLGSKLTDRNENELQKLFLSAIIMIILSMVFAELIW